MRNHPAAESTISGKKDKMKTKTIAVFALAVLLSIGMVALIFRANENSTLKIFTTKLNTLGLSVSDAKINAGTIRVSFSTGKDKITAEDLLLARYIHDTVLFQEGHRTVEVSLLTSGNETVYSDSSSGQKKREDYSIYNTENPGTIDDAFLQTKLKYGLFQNGIECQGVKIAGYPQTYVTKAQKLRDKTVNISVIAEESAVPEILGVIERMVSEFNQEGAFIAQYNLQIKDAEGAILYLGSFDLLTSDSIVLQ